MDCRPRNRNEIDGIVCGGFDKPSMDRAIGDTEPDSVSWHYTVDDHQSFKTMKTTLPAGMQVTAAQSAAEIKTASVSKCVSIRTENTMLLSETTQDLWHHFDQTQLEYGNVKRHRDFMSKDCPETMIKERRWFEFLDLVAKEYISQTLCRNSR